MVNTNIVMAPSPRQPLSGHGVQRITGIMRLSRAKSKFKIATTNISTMNGKEEVVEVMKTRNLSVLRLCETRTKGNGERVLHGDYKLFFSGRDDGRHGIGAVLVPEIASERMVTISVCTRFRKFSLFQIHAPQSGRPVQEKDQFYNMLQNTIVVVKYKEYLIVCGDYNGHIGLDGRNVENMIRAFSASDRNVKRGKSD